MKEKLTSILLILSCLSLSQNVFAVTAPPKNLSTYYKANTYAVSSKVPTTTPTVAHTNFSQCIKTYPLSTESLLYMCLSALSINNYRIEEIQFKTGTVIFTANSKEYILITARKDIKNSFIKILPSDNNYNFPPITINRIYNYIDQNYGLGIQNII